MRIVSVLGAALSTFVDIEMLQKLAAVGNESPPGNSGKRSGANKGKKHVSLRSCSNRRKAKQSRK